MTREDVKQRMEQKKGVYFFDPQDQIHHCGEILRIQDDGIVVLKGLDFPGITGIPISELKTGLKEGKNGC